MSTVSPGQKSATPGYDKTPSNHEHDTQIHDNNISDTPDPNTSEPASQSLNSMFPDSTEPESIEPENTGSPVSFSSTTNKHDSLTTGVAEHNHATDTNPHEPSDTKSEPIQQQELEDSLFSDSVNDDIKSDVCFQPSQKEDGQHDISPLFDNSTFQQEQELKDNSSASFQNSEVDQNFDQRTEDQQPESIADNTDLISDQRAQHDQQHKDELDPENFLGLASDSFEESFRSLSQSLDPETSAQLEGLDIEMSDINAIPKLGDQDLENSKESADLPTTVDLPEPSIADTLADNSSFEHLKVNQENDLSDLHNISLDDMNLEDFGELDETEMESFQDELKELKDFKDFDVKGPNDAKEFRGFKDIKDIKALKDIQLPNYDRTLLDQTFIESLALTTSTSLEGLDPTKHKEKDILDTIPFDIILPEQVQNTLLSSKNISSSGFDFSALNSISGSLPSDTTTSAATTSTAEGNASLLETSSVIPSMNLPTSNDEESNKLSSSNIEIQNDDSSRHQQSPRIEGSTSAMLTDTSEKGFFDTFHDIKNFKDLDKLDSHMKDFEKFDSLNLKDLKGFENLNASLLSVKLPESLEAVDALRHTSMDQTESPATTDVMETVAQTNTTTDADLDMQLFSNSPQSNNASAVHSLSEIPDLSEIHTNISGHIPDLESLPNPSELASTSFPAVPRNNHLIRAQSEAPDSSVQRPEIQKHPASVPHSPTLPQNDINFFQGLPHPSSLAESTSNLAIPMMQMSLDAAGMAFKSDDNVPLKDNILTEDQIISDSSRIEQPDKNGAELSDQQRLQQDNFANSIEHQVYDEVSDRPTYQLSNSIAPMIAPGNTGIATPGAFNQSPSLMPVDSISATPFSKQPSSLNKEASSVFKPPASFKALPSPLFPRSKSDKSSTLQAITALNNSTIETEDSEIGSTEYENLGGLSNLPGVGDDVDDDVPRVSAYARLDFPTFIFYVQTLQVILGRSGNNSGGSIVDVDLGSVKAISRKHAKIFYNFGTQRFELSVLGRNGAFVDEEFIETGTTVPLKDGVKIQIGQISFTFVLPPSDDAKSSEDKSGELSANDKEGGSTSIENKDQDTEMIDISKLDDGDKDSGINDEKGEDTQDLYLDDKADKKKDGKKKIDPKISKDGNKKPGSKPRSQPQREYLPEEIPEEYREKPQFSYSHLITTALRAHPEAQGISLSKIYKSIQDIFPYYQYCPHGWKNSVRHNLSSNKVFKKISKEGKGWLWGIDEEYFQERERARQKAAQNNRNKEREKAAAAAQAQALADARAKAKEEKELAQQKESAIALANEKVVPTAQGNMEASMSHGSLQRLNNNAPSNSSGQAPIQITGAGNTIHQSQPISMENTSIPRNVTAYSNSSDGMQSRIPGQFNGPQLNTQSSTPGNIQNPQPLQGFSNTSAKSHNQSQLGLSSEHSANQNVQIASVSVPSQQQATNSASHTNLSNPAQTQKLQPTSMSDKTSTPAPMNTQGSTLQTSTNTKSQSLQTPSVNFTTSTDPSLAAIPTSSNTSLYTSPAIKPDFDNLDKLFGSNVEGAISSEISSESLLNHMGNISATSQTLSISSDPLTQIKANPSDITQSATQISNDEGPTNLVGTSISSISNTGQMSASSISQASAAALAAAAAAAADKKKTIAEIAREITVDRISRPDYSNMMRESSGSPSLAPSHSGEIKNTSGVVEAGSLANPLGSRIEVVKNGQTQPKEQPQLKTAAVYDSSSVLNHKKPIGSSTPDINTTLTGSGNTSNANPAPAANKGKIVSGANMSGLTFGNITDSLGTLPAMPDLPATTSTSYYTGPTINAPKAPLVTKPAISKNVKGKAIPAKKSNTKKNTKPSNPISTNSASKVNVPTRQQSSTGQQTLQFTSSMQNSQTPNSSILTNVPHQQNIGLGQAKNQASLVHQKGDLRVQNKPGNSQLAGNIQTAVGTSLVSGINQGIVNKPAIPARSNTQTLNTNRPPSMSAQQFNPALKNRATGLPTTPALPVSVKTASSQQPQAHISNAKSVAAPSVSGAKVPLVSTAPKPATVSATSSSGLKSKSSSPASGPSSSRSGSAPAVPLSKDTLRVLTTLSEKIKKQIQDTGRTITQDMLTNALAIAITQLAKNGGNKAISNLLNGSNSEQLFDTISSVVLEKTKKMTNTSTSLAQKGSVPAAVLAQNKPASSATSVSQVSKQSKVPTSNTTKPATVQGAPKVSNPGNTQSQTLKFQNLQSTPVPRSITAPHAILHPPSGVPAGVVPIPDLSTSSHSSVPNSYSTGIPSSITPRLKVPQSISNPNFGALSSSIPPSMRLHSAAMSLGVPPPPGMLPNSIGTASSPLNVTSSPYYPSASVAKSTSPVLQKEPQSLSSSGKSDAPKKVAVGVSKSQSKGKLPASSTATGTSNTLVSSTTQKASVKSSNVQLNRPTTLGTQPTKEQHQGTGKTHNQISGSHASHQQKQPATPAAQTTKGIPPTTTKPNQPHPAVASSINPVLKTTVVPRVTTQKNNSAPVSPLVAKSTTPTSSLSSKPVVNTAATTAQGPSTNTSASRPQSLPTPTPSIPKPTSKISGVSKSSSKSPSPGLSTGAAGLGIKPGKDISAQAQQISEMLSKVSRLKNPSPAIQASIKQLQSYAVKLGLTPEGKFIPKNDPSPSSSSPAPIIGIPNNSVAGVKRPSPETATNSLNAQIDSNNLHPDEPHLKVMKSNDTITVCSFILTLIIFILF